jgi:hypothetical protein
MQSDILTHACYSKLIAIDDIGTTNTAAGDAPLDSLRRQAKVQFDCAILMNERPITAIHPRAVR